jgi:16S rRNA (guanine966-N2)-methyltransferase
LRICGGEFRGRRLASFRGLTLRPTPEHIREAIFNILGQDLHDVEVLDLFAGTGALGLEALSRGALKAVFVDKSPQAVAVIKENVKNLMVQDRVQVVRYDLTRGLTPLDRVDGDFKLVFLDPPYGKNMAETVLQKLDRWPRLKPGSIIVAEHFEKELIPSSFQSLELREKRSYGQTAVSIFEKV